MTIVGAENLTSDQMHQEILRGGKFVIYQYCISALLVTFKRSSNVYFIRANESAVAKGLGYTATSLALGWWGLPWGPIYTIQTIWANVTGGHDVTPEILAQAAAKT
jgi:hypothetical protein